MKPPVELINEMSHHLGQANGIGADELSLRLRVSPRVLRRQISWCRDQGISICGHPSTGYYMPETAEELEASCAFLHARAMHSLNLLARMRRVAMPTLMGQLLLAQG
jgi:predicted DNA-binding transcriptional regulator YafY